MRETASFFPTAANAPNLAMPALGPKRDSYAGALSSSVASPAHDVTGGSAFVSPRGSQPVHESDKPKKISIAVGKEPHYSS